MNDNVTPFRKTTSASLQKTISRSRQVMRHVMGYHNPHPVWPAWVIANPEFNQKATYLHQQGWAVEPVCKNLFSCTHPMVKTAHRLHLEGAWRIQTEMEEKLNKGMLQWPAQ